MSDSKRAKSREGGPLESGGGGRRRNGETPGTGGASSKGVNAPPEVVYKMSKKIAQLTKVIYYLNTKNEDHNVEVQSLVDAYEEELAEAIKDGSNQVRELQSKVEESEIQLRAHEEIIQSYLDKITAYEADLEEAKRTEGELKDTIKYMKREHVTLHDTVRKSMEQLAEAEEKSRATEETLGTEVQKISGSFEDEIRELKARHQEDLDKLQLQTAKNIKSYADECKLAQEQLRETVTNMTRQNEEQLRNHEAQISSLKDDYETQIRVLKHEKTEIEARLTAELTETRAIQEDASNRAEELQEQAKTKENQVRSLTELLEKSTNQAQSTQAMLSTEKIKTESLSKELAIATDRITELNELNTTLEQEVASKVARLDQIEAEYRSLKDEFDKAQVSLDTLNHSLDSANGTIKELNEKIHDLNRVKADLEVQRIEKERAYHQLEESIKELQRQWKLDLASALKKQEIELKDQHQIDVSEKLAQAATEYEETIAANEKELEDAKKAWKKEVKSWEVKLNAEVEKAEEFASRMSNLHNTVKGLEVDKADLFQKMVRIDDQIRSELNEKFKKDKREIEEQMEEQHNIRMNILKEQIAADQHQLLLAAITHTENEYKAQIERITTDHMSKCEEWSREREEMSKKASDAEEQVRFLMRSMMELKESHSKKIADLIESHLESLESERRAWETEASSKETQLKVTHTIAIGNLEKKHATQKEELEATHKRLMDELRNTNTKNALAAKKEAEAQRTADLAKQRALHLEEMDKLTQKHVAELAETVLSMNVQRLGELKALNEDNEKVMAAKEEELNKLRDEIEERMSKEEELNEKIENYESDLESMREQLETKSQELDSLRDQSLRALREREMQLLAEQEQIIQKLNEEHIEEAQKMIEQFEQAQNFLKKQIQAQAKQLEEADLRYINREPREVDLQRIAELEDEIRRRKRKTNALTDELDYCKLEMYNRELNFNKIFSKSPLVGVIDPIAAKMKAKKEHPSHPGLPPKADSLPRLPPLYSPQMTPSPAPSISIYNTNRPPQH
ncbi:hypothetical protein HDV05_007756 [Chytridiales sp. JEL 0842]|nr:hypothetical protein HDV05_007756 [Chytridiales sp. JEL 0842]